MDLVAKYPNPEEGKSALKLSFEKADSIQSTTILANDPDADRLAVAEKDPNTGEWKVFNGNELGALLGWWIFKIYKEMNPDMDMKNVYMLASTVSSKILRSMSEENGFQFIETLTGFKWMGMKAYELMTQNKEVIFAFEEAIGFMCDKAVLDKDGVTAAAHAASLCSYLKSKDSSLIKKLQEIYDQYGYHVSKNSYFLCQDARVPKAICDHIRSFDGPNKYPSTLCNKYKLKNVRDLTTGYDDSQPDKKAILPVDCSSQMITLTYDNGFVVTIRNSGTEPKLKYYSELCSKKEKAEAEQIITEMIDEIVNLWFEPDKYHLVEAD